MLKKTLNLPNNSCNDYLYGERESGLLGIPLAAEDSDIANVDGAVKLLLSKNPIICNIAWSEIREVANWRFDSDDDGDILKYLNSVPGIRNSNRYKSQWSRARAASGRLKLTWNIREPDLVSVAFGKNVVCNKNHVFRSLRSTFKKNRTLGFRFARISYHFLSKSKMF